MRHLMVAAALLLASSNALLAQSSPVAVRPVRPWIADLVGRVVDASSTLDALLHRLACSSFIVHVSDDVPPDARFDGRTRFVGQFGAFRYLRIDIRRSRSDVATGGLLAHELQHAVEALEGEVFDKRSFRGLFARIGLAHPPFGPELFETSAAIEIGARAAREIELSLPHGTSRSSSGPRERESTVGCFAGRRTQ